VEVTFLRAAIRAYLDLHQLTEHVALVLGRHGEDPEGKSHRM